MDIKIMRPFPVKRLNESITQAISKIVSIGIHKGIEDGLDPRIQKIKPRKLLILN